MEEELRKLKAGAYDCLFVIETKQKELNELNKRIMELNAKKQDLCQDEQAPSLTV